MRPELIVLAAGGLLSAVAYGQQAPPPTELGPRLSLDRALGIARERGLDLLIADAAVAAARADELQAAAVANPALSASVGKSFSYDPSKCPGCSDLAWSVGVSDQGALVDAVSGKRGLRREVAGLALQAARASREDAQRLLEFQVKQLYFQVALAQASLAFALEVRAAMTATLELIQVRYRTGAVSEAELAKAETAELEAEQDVEGAQQGLRDARVGLAFVLGVRGAAPDFEVDGAVLAFRVPSSLEPAPRERLLEEARAHRPDLAAARQQVECAGRARTLARRLLVPEVNLGLQAAGEGTGQDALAQPTASLSLGLVPPLAYQFQGEQARAEADLAAQRLQLARLEAQVAAEVEVSWADYLSARHQVERMEARLLDRARTARDLTRIQYEKGVASLLEYLDAQRTFISNNLEYLKDQADYWTAVAQLERAVGKELAR
ncbi:MAG TPA: TolC family protein [Myxococcales bacterium]|jgi:cobalt-zinc-cadmium efflux system outer membrane protein